MGEYSYDYIGTDPLPHLQDYDDPLAIDGAESEAPRLDGETRLEDARGGSSR